MPIPPHKRMSKLDGAAMSASPKRKDEPSSSGSVLEAGDAVNILRMENDGLRQRVSALESELASLHEQYVKAVNDRDDLLGEERADLFELEKEMRATEIDYKREIAKSVTILAESLAEMLGKEYKKK